MPTGMMRISEWPKLESLHLERTRIEDFHRRFTRNHLNKWNLPIEQKDKQEQFVRQTFVEIQQGDGENWYIIQENESRAKLVTIIATHRKFDELEIIFQWFELAERFVNQTVTKICVIWDIPFPDWIKSPASKLDSGESLKPQTAVNLASEQPKEVVTPQPPMLISAKRETNPGVKAHADAIKRLLDGETREANYYQWRNEYQAECGDFTNKRTLESELYRKSVWKPYQKKLAGKI